MILNLYINENIEIKFQMIYKIIRCRWCIYHKNIKYDKANLRIKDYTKILMKHIIKHTKIYKKRKIKWLKLTKNIIFNIH